MVPVVVRVSQAADVQTVTLTHALARAGVMGGVPEAAKAATGNLNKRMEGLP